MRGFISLALLSLSACIAAPLDKADAENNVDPYHGALDAKQVRAIVGIVNQKAGTDYATCTGVFVARDWVMTAAHCLDGGHDLESQSVWGPSQTNEIDIDDAIKRIRINIGGRKVFKKPDIYVKADQIIPHPALDIALLHTASPIDNITPIQVGALGTATDSAVWFSRGCWLSSFCIEFNGKITSGEATIFDQTDALTLTHGSDIGGSHPNRGGAGAPLISWVVLDGVSTPLVQGMHFYRARKKHVNKLGEEVLAATQSHINSESDAWDTLDKRAMTLAAYIRTDALTNWMSDVSTDAGSPISIFGQ